MGRSFRLVSIVAVALLFISGCSADDDAGDVEIVVAVASSLQDAFGEIGERFEAQSSHAVTFSFGSSGNLATQIENGAPFDVFAAANVEFVDGLIAGGFVNADSQRLYAIGEIALASNIASGVNAQRLEDLLSPDIRHVAIANPEHAPYGMAARDALVNAGLWDELEPKIVYGENIRQTLQFVETGNADAGIVALSIVDVPDVQWVVVDRSLYEPVVHAMGMVSATSQPDAAREFMDFVTGPEGVEILERHGFARPE